MKFVKSVPKAFAILMVGVVLLFFSWMAPISGFVLGTGGTDYYVDNSVDSEGDGSSLSPWKTLHWAIHEINTVQSPSGAGTLHVTYNAELPYSVANGEANSSLVITQSGFSPLTIVGTDSQNKPVIAARVGDLGRWFPNCCLKRADQNLVLQNFVAYSSGIEIVSGTNNIIENCEIRWNQYGVHILSTSSGNQIRNGCSIHDNGDVGIYIYGSDSNRIFGNTIYDNDPIFGGIGVHVQSEGDGGHLQTITRSITTLSTGRQTVRIRMGYNSAG